MVFINCSFLNCLFKKAKVNNTLLHKKLVFFSSKFIDCKFKRIEIDELQLTNSKNISRFELDEVRIDKTLKIQNNQDADKISISNYLTIRSGDYREYISNNKYPFYLQWRFLKLFRSIPLLKINYILLFIMGLIYPIAKPILKNFFLKEQCANYFKSNSSEKYAIFTFDLICNIQIKTNVWLLFLSFLLLLVSSTTHILLEPKHRIVVQGNSQISYAGIREICINSRRRSLLYTLFISYIVSAGYLLYFYIQKIMPGLIT